MAVGKGGSKFTFLREQECTPFLTIKKTFVYFTKVLNNARDRGITDIMLNFTFVFVFYLKR